MTTIGKLLERDFSKPIEEIIKVNNADEEIVHAELSEYIATDRIKDQYRRLLKAMADAPSVPTEGIGVWISGFFGSGKSSFAKNLGYVLANRSVLGEAASEVFVRQLKDKQVTDYVQWLNQKIPSEVFMFDVQVDLAVQTNAEQIAEVMYRVLLRELDYAEDYDIAELEMKLESEGKLEAFKEACQSRYRQDWRSVRKGAAKFSRASAILHEIDKKSAPTETAFLEEVKARPIQRLTVKEIVEKTFDLCARRRPGKAFVFIVDEMGQYVARSAEKLENLRAVVEQFGRVSLERLKKRQIPAPAWIIVTAQEKLEEVYDYIGSGRVELPKLQDRFKHRIDLSPADIREVATKRVLNKTDEGRKVLAELFRKYEGRLKDSARLERTHRKYDFTEEEFIDTYPYLPHYIDLSIDIMHGLRTQKTVPQHFGGSNRTVIRQADQMIAGDRTRMFDQQLGTLVTLDKVYELIEGNMPSEKQKDILDIRKRFERGGAYPGLAARAAKAICLLEFVRDLPRTPRNIAALLVENIGDPSPVTAVESVLQTLKEAQFVRETDDGWKLQTAQEKNWESEKRGLASLKRGERNELLRKAVKDIFDSAKIRNYNYKGLRTFTLSLSLDGHAVMSGGQIPLELIAIDEAEDFVKRQNDLTKESLQDANRDRVLWLFQVPGEAERLLGEEHASAQMIFKYDNLRSQNKITAEEAASLQMEKAEALQLEKRVAGSVSKALESGVGFFRGIKLAPGDLGDNVKTLADIVRGLCSRSVPDLYPKVELGCRPLDGDEPEEFLKQSNLSALPQVFYSDQGLNLVLKEGGRFVPNPNAEIAREILDYLKREHQYGNKVTGKQIAEHFGGLGYGWEQDVVRLVLAVLFRAGTIMVTHQGRPYRNYQEPQARVPFANNTSFRGASFAPRESIDLKTLTTAVRTLEEMIGQEVDVEEGAIAEAFQKLARGEKDTILPALAIAQANLLPLSETLREWNESLDAVLSGSSDDCVRMLAGEGKTLRELRDNAQKARVFLSQANLEKIRQARAAAEQLAPALGAAGQDALVGSAGSELEQLLRSVDLPEKVGDITRLANSINAAYEGFYRKLHRDRFELYTKAIDEIKGMADFLQLDEASQETVLQPLIKRAIKEIDLSPFESVPRNTFATLGELQADIDARPGLQATAVRRMMEILARGGDEKVKVQRVRVSDFFTGPKDPQRSEKENIEASLERLREHVYSLLDEGVKIIWE